MTKPMRTLRTMLVILTGTVLSFALSCQNQESVNPYLGSWALTLDYSENSAGWLDVSEEDGSAAAEILWRWASVYSPDTMVLEGNVLYLVKGKDMILEEDPFSVQVAHPGHWFMVSLEGPDRLSGEAVFPDEDGNGAEKVTFTGRRVPPVGEAPDLSQVQFGEPVALFNGTDLAGWELMGDDAANGWTVEDGVLFNNPVQPDTSEHLSYGNLRTSDVFGDFNLQLEVNLPPGSNSGVYLRGIYEVQVFDSYGLDPDPHHMGAVYSRITPSEPAEKPAGEWQTLDITLCQRHVTVVLNGRTIIDNRPVKGVTGGALTSDVFSPGPVYLQGDHGAVRYRNLLLTPIMGGS